MAVCPRHLLALKAGRVLLAGKRAIASTRQERSVDPTVKQLDQPRRAAYRREAAIGGLRRIAQFPQGPDAPSVGSARASRRVPPRPPRAFAATSWKPKPSHEPCAGRATATRGARRLPGAAPRPPLWGTAAPTCDRRPAPPAPSAAPRMGCWHLTPTSWSRYARALTRGLTPRIVVSSPGTYTVGAPGRSRHRHAAMSDCSEPHWSRIPDVPDRGLGKPVDLGLSEDRLVLAEVAKAPQWG